MSKELPFFKFFPSEWLSGDITLESYETQGLFINICSYYWQRDCKVPLDNLRKKFQGHNGIDILISLGMLKIKGKYVLIGFLSEQFIELNEKRKKLSESGKLGNKIRWETNKIKAESVGDGNPITTQSQNNRNIDKEEDKDIRINITNYSLHETYINDIEKNKDTVYAVWLQGIYMSFKLSNGSIGKLLWNFINQLKMDGKMHPDFNDFKKHFNNWLRKQDSIGKLNEYKQKRMGSL